MEWRLHFQLCAWELETWGRVNLFFDGQMLPWCWPHLLLDGGAAMHLNSIVWKSPAFQEEQPARRRDWQMSWLPGGRVLLLLCPESLPLSPSSTLANDGGLWCRHWGLCQVQRGANESTWNRTLRPMCLRMWQRCGRFSDCEHAIWGGSGGEPDNDGVHKAALREDN